MELMPNGQPIVIVKSPVPFYLLPKFYLLGILVFVIFSGIGFSVSKFSPLLKPKLSNNFPVNGAVKTPVSLDILQNPMFSNWTARVKGRVTDKDQQSFIISNITEMYTATGSAVIKDANDGKALQIQYVKGKTSFQRMAADLAQQKPNFIDFSNIGAGTLLNGLVEIYKDGNRWFLIGKIFTINDIQKK